MATQKMFCRRKSVIAILVELKNGLKINVIINVG